MKLASYLSANGCTYADFAQKVGASTFAVGKWVRGERLPRPGVLSRIVAETGGQVTANDFFGHTPGGAPHARSEAA
jgi:transcriptional regulator with XRE-family HTH domain